MEPIASVRAYSPAFVGVGPGQSADRVDEGGVSGGVGAGGPLHLLDGVERAPPVSVAAIIDSVFRLQSMDSDELSVRAFETVTRTRDLVQSVQTGRLITGEERTRAAYSRLQNKIEEARRKVEEAEEAREKSLKWRIISGGLAGASGTLSVIFGAFLTALPGGAVLGVSLILGGALSGVTSADSAVGAKRGKGFLNEKAAMGLGIAGAVVGVSTLGGSIAASGRLGATIADKFATNLPKIAAGLSSKAMTESMVNKSVLFVQGVTDVGDSGAAIGSAAVDIQTGNISAEATGLQADVGSIRGAMEFLHAETETVLDFMIRTRKSFDAADAAFMDLVEDKRRLWNSARIIA